MWLCVVTAEEEEEISGAGELLLVIRINNHLGNGFIRLIPYQNEP